jgi:hypothetical protein
MVIFVSFIQPHKNNDSLYELKKWLIIMYFYNNWGLIIDD